MTLVIEDTEYADELAKVARSCRVNRYPTTNGRVCGMRVCVKPKHRARAKFEMEFGHPTDINAVWERRELLQNIRDGHVEG